MARCSRRPVPWRSIASRCSPASGLLFVNGSFFAFRASDMTPRPIVPPSTAFRPTSVVASATLRPADDPPASATDTFGGRVSGELPSLAMPPHLLAAARLPRHIANWLVQKLAEEFAAADPDSPVPVLLAQYGAITPIPRIPPPLVPAPDLLLSVTPEPPTPTSDLVRTRSAVPDEMPVDPLDNPTPTWPPPPTWPPRRKRHRGPTK